MLEPIRIKLFFLTIFFISKCVCLLHFEILPLVNLPEDFPCPEYSKAKKPRLYFFEKFRKFFGFSPSKSDIKPCKKTIYVWFFFIILRNLIFPVFEVLK